jgi:hypothetical protein
MKIKDISNEKIVIEAPVGVFQRAKEKFKAAPPTWLGGSVQAKRKNLVSQEMNRVWKIVKQKLSQDLKGQYVPVDKFTEVMKQLGYLKSTEAVISSYAKPAPTAEPEAAPTPAKAAEPKTPSYRGYAGKKQKAAAKKESIEYRLTEDEEDFTSISNVLNKKDVEKLIREIITLAAKNNPEEFTKKASDALNITTSADKSASTGSEESTTISNKDTTTRSSSGRIEAKPFQRAFDQAKNKVVRKLPRKEQDQALNDLEDILTDLYSKLS